jgi:hypothetical protein
MPVRGVDADEQPDTLPGTASYGPPGDGQPPAGAPAAHGSLPMPITGRLGSCPDRGAKTAIVTYSKYTAGQSTHSHEIRGQCRLKNASGWVGRAGKGAG